MVSSQRYTEIDASHLVHGRGRSGFSTSFLKESAEICGGDYAATSSISSLTWVPMALRLTVVSLLYLVLKAIQQAHNSRRTIRRKGI
ncbi:hypothetical protein BGAL_0597g00060 [Botrytis galanthina]|uniref:Uncharacterized protein n=1 Tax=Botrytis galanthina TaxID=278940 RepID=A0A4S8QL80_9HELO|nr:hypothetical protein BGAL_0597g00060 [Botrytis galanthina]